METLKLNETPVRTSRNFNINNMKLEGVYIPEKIEKFNHIEIIGGNSENKVTSNTKSCHLTYGLGKELTNQVEKQANQKLNIILEGKQNQEMKIEFQFDENNKQLVEHIEIEAQKETKATVIIQYKSQEDILAFHNGIIKLHAKEKASINVILINFMNQNSNNFLSIENELQKEAKVTYTIIDFGGKNSFTNVYSSLKGTLSNSIINTLYLGNKDQILDLNYIAQLQGEKTSVNIQVEGALKDNAKKHFKGTIDFKKGCKKAIGNEMENCMLLSDKAKSIALPMLLCAEEEVEGNHSTSAGKVGEKELFYLMSRGIEKKEAMKLMVKARFYKILEGIKKEELKKGILQEIDARLD